MCCLFVSLNRADLRLVKSSSSAPGTVQAEESSDSRQGTKRPFPGKNAGRVNCGEKFSGLVARCRGLDVAVEGDTFGKALIGVGVCYPDVCSPRPLPRRRGVSDPLYSLHDTQLHLPVALPYQTQPLSTVTQQTQVLCALHLLQNPI